MCKPKPTDLWGDVGVSECMHVYKHGYGWRLVDVLEANAQTTKRPNDQTTNDFFFSVATRRRSVADRPAVESSLPLLGVSLA